MIQIIEDDLVTCQIIAALLKRMRYESCQAYTGTEALEQLRTRPVDMVIADMVLPDMHGLDLLEQKHNLPYVRDIPVVCCTAHADIETVEAAMGFGAVDFVKKPIIIQAFAARINRAVERAPVRWESWGEMNKRLPFYGRTIEPMLLIAQQVLRELDNLLAEAQQGNVNVNDINAMVLRARGTAQNVGAIRTVQQIDYLWTGMGTSNEIEYLRAALVIELASFEEAIQSRAAANEPALAVVG
jgi:DNA-binding NtrC family response regulator